MNVYIVTLVQTAPIDERSKIDLIRRLDPLPSCKTGAVVCDPFLVVFGIYGCRIRPHILTKAIPKSEHKRRFSTIHETYSVFRMP